MIRKLHEKDRITVLEFLNEDPSINIFIIGDIETYGFNNEMQELWGQFSDDGQMEGVLLRYRESFIPYYNNPNIDNTDFVNIMLNYKEYKVISGKSSIISKFQSMFPDYKISKTYFCELNNIDELNADPLKNIVKIAKESDAKRICDLLNTIDEFNSIINDPERVKTKLINKAGRSYYIENDKGEMVSIAQTTAENTSSAMIVGVATLKEYRKHGYVSECMAKLCTDILKEGKTICLFYDNPKAGKIYHRLGFKTIDNWTMLKKSRVN
ncbi:N-acetyltransferase [Vallitalea longa]|uniref:N-acetyltransferase n=1 Tax=Vallitalea longa TaxID=2936439 RepID=A0A9W6DFC9_9FIRM|nr:GNAT family N-acetyltransferase [Vallitalea longa]GKX31081.1 N-acetyltransferase [Vallitalea longa]